METSSSSGVRVKSLGDYFSVGGFWDFVVERHKIWYRRFIEQQPPPWTEDPILKDFFFCNIFRRLDKGTQWYLKYVAITNDFPDILWKTISYRLINMPEAFIAANGDPIVADRNGWRQQIDRMKQIGFRLHSKAYLTLPRPHHLHTRVERFEYVLGELEMGFDGLVQVIYEANTLEEVSHHLKQQYGIGNFLSLQIYRDLILAGQIPFTDDDWIEIGPGAKQGLLMLFGPQARGEKAQRGLIYWLAQSQEKPLAERGFWDFEGMKISAGDIEQCICEYNKHCKLSAGQGKRRYYRKSQ